jgi:LysM repeat protein
MARALDDGGSSGTPSYSDSVEENRFKNQAAAATKSAAPAAAPKKSVLKVNHKAMVEDQAAEKQAAAAAQAAFAKQREQERAFAAQQAEEAAAAASAAALSAKNKQAAEEARLNAAAQGDSEEQAAAAAQYALDHQKAESIRLANMNKQAAEEARLTAGYEADSPGRADTLAQYGAAQNRADQAAVNDANNAAEERKLGAMGAAAQADADIYGAAQRVAKRMDANEARIGRAEENRMVQAEKQIAKPEMAAIDAQYAGSVEARRIANQGVVAQNDLANAQYNAIEERRLMDQASPQRSGFVNSLLDLFRSSGKKVGFSPDYSNDVEATIAAQYAKEQLAPTITPKPMSYSVVSGDNLTAIAKSYGINAETLLKLNPDIKNPNLIRPGQVINLPGGSVEVPQHIELGDAPAPHGSSPSPRLAEHTVVAGDNMSAIAARNGMKLNELLSLNKHIKNPNLIHPGDKIILSSAAAGGTADAGEESALASSPINLTAFRRDS